MSVWYCIPSARPAAEAEIALSKWRSKGYKIALFVDPGHESPRADYVYEAKYPGYAIAVNSLIHKIMIEDPEAEWFVTGGDDIWPDQNHTAEDLATECFEYFVHRDLQDGPPQTLSQRLNAAAYKSGNGSFGVMQPTGDRWGDGPGPWKEKGSAYCDRVCGSPWMGREFCRRIYSGRGPIWPEFTHMFEDEHLFNVAQKLGILWQREDLTHYHDHWVRRANAAGGFASQEVYDQAQPAHLKTWSQQAHWDESKAIFERLKAGGFAEAEDLLA